MNLLKVGTSPAAAPIVPQAIGGHGKPLVRRSEPEQIARLEAREAGSGRVPATFACRDADRG
jgi:hypothetical protein